MLSRLTTSSSRRVASNALRSGASLRMYSDSRSDGSVATSKGFSKREKAQEDQYAMAHEKQLLDKLRKDIESKQQELVELEKTHKAEQEKLAGKK
jgi:predicted ferric reductase